MPKGSWGKKGENATAFKHGMSNSPEYQAWNHMMLRCYNEWHPAYKNYGGRGIKVHPEWHDFKKFYEYIGPRPSRTHSLERINNSKEYEPGNVTWDTAYVQQNNNRNVVMVDYLGTPVSLTVAIRAEGDKVKYTTARHRLNKGWSLMDAITIPAGTSINKPPEPDLGYSRGQYPL